MLTSKDFNSPFNIYLYFNITLCKMNIVYFMIKNIFKVTSLEDLGAATLVNFLDHVVNNSHVDLIGHVDQVDQSFSTGVESVTHGWTC